MSQHENRQSRAAAPATGRVGILGGGQLARMSAEAAVELGVSVVVLDPEPGSPAGQVTRQIVAGWTDECALENLAREIDVVTLENEFVDPRALEILIRHGVKARPSLPSFTIVRDKLVQKQHLAAHGLPVGPFTEASSANDVRRFAARHDWPVVLKARSHGYDGRGVAVARNAGELESAMQLLGSGARSLLVEAQIAFEAELATMVVRGIRGEIACYPVVETVQAGFVCALVRAPAAIPTEVAARARDTAVRAVEAIDGAGVHGVEMFLTQSGEVVVNEIAPRPHNSGHYTIEACATSQFENHLRAVLGWPLGPTDMRVPAAVMVNVLATRSGSAAALDAAVLRAPRDLQAKIHLYGKRELRPGRKMGHVTALGSTLREAEKHATSMLEALDV
jgi:5-(carboxyamino)imidazole ribonucleotide synthase